MIRLRRRFAESVKIMVALSILFSYGLQFCVPSEIMWTWLEPWLRKRTQNIVHTSSNDKEPSGVAVVSTDATTVCVEEMMQLELETKVQENPIHRAYYFMRGSMILGTGKQATRYSVPDKDWNLIIE